jgi:hypothetical protein
VIERDLKPHDLVFIPSGTHIDMKVAPQRRATVPLLLYRNPRVQQARSLASSHDGRRCRGCQDPQRAHAGGVCR